MGGHTRGMTMNAISQGYIKPKEAGTDLEDFALFLISRNMAPITIKRHMKSIRICEMILAKDVYQITEQDFERLTEELGNVAQSTKDSYILAYRRYYEFCSGIDPLENNGQTGRHFCPMGIRSTVQIELYSEDLDRYELHLRQNGTKETEIEMVMKCIRHCLKMIIAVDGHVDVYKISKFTLIGLERMMSGLKRATVRRYLVSLGMFVLFMTGTNPYQDYIDSTDFRKVAPKENRADAQIEEFTNHSWKNGDKERTYRRKAETVRRCIERLDRIVGKVKFEEIGHGEIVELVRDMQASGLKDSTIRKYIMDFGLFLGHVTGSNPVRIRNLPLNNSEAHRKFIFRDDFKKMLNRADPEEFLILSLGATLGLRANEIASIMLDDINGKEIFVRGKGRGKGKVAKFELSPMVLDGLDEYMRYRSEIIEKYGDGSKGHLFVNAYMNRGTPMSVNAVEGRIKALGQKVDVILSSHCLRRLFCTTMYDLGEDEVVIQRMMRHSDLNTTRECYYYADPRKVLKTKTDLENTLLA